MMKTHKLTNLTAIIYLTSLYLLFFSTSLKAQRNALPDRIESDSVTIEFMGYSRLDGMPLYYITHNLNAAKTISTNEVWQGGDLNLNLTGEDMVIGIWDGDAVRATHQELIGRVTQMDGETKLSHHATHVAGTMSATGINLSAKGGAYQADLQAYDWSNDETEMAIAANNGLLISNHSYGFVTGWRYNKQEDYWFWHGNTDVSEIEDYKFGFYSNTSKEWDEIAYNAPHYLIVKSAGNDRNDIAPPIGSIHYLYNSNYDTIESTIIREKDGGMDGYDCISHAGLSKNIMTVGAVEDLNNGYTNANEVLMSSFSSWGPTDDGRIKPDIVANGTILFSCDEGGDSSYETKSGTSMASPSVAGSLLLLQEHYHNLQNTHLQAATLKALAIHTADEAGTSEGPDYQFGWGLMNTKKAATVISQNAMPSDTLIEAHLNQADTYQLTVFSDGTQGLTTTLCWTDPAGTVPAISLNPTDLMLVNDLDMCLTNNTTGETYYPYILDPSNPATAATKGDNFRDNVEKIYWATPSAGAYTLTISHKNTLTNGSQDFGLIISGMSASTCAITADFNYTQDGATFTFTNASTDADVYTWNFGDGNTSYAPNPDHTYTASGTYMVCLTANNSCGNDTDCQEVIIEVCGYSGEDLQADFSIPNPPNCTGTSIQFTNTSMGTSPTASYEWRIGGMLVSTDTDLNHVFSSTGNYAIELTVIDGVNCIDSYEAVVYIATTPNADFAFTTNNLAVDFNHLSSNADSFTWDFGDGNTSTIPNPNYTYLQSNTYQVCLTVNNECGSHMSCKTVQVNGTCPSYTLEDSNSNLIGNGYYDMGDCVVLTNQVFNTTAVWSNNMIDLNDSFEFSTEVLLGNADGGHENGITFTLQNDLIGTGAIGAGEHLLGIGGSTLEEFISPSVSICLNTFPDFDQGDRIELRINGEYPTAFTPVLATPIEYNIEDGNYHDLKVKWDATAQKLLCYFDGYLRAVYELDMIDDIFLGTNAVYWGVTGTTGAFNHTRSVCNTILEACPIPCEVNAWFYSPVEACGLSYVNVNFTNYSTNANDYEWQVNGNVVSTTSTHLQYTFTEAGTYLITLRAIGDDCEDGYSQEIVIRNDYQANFDVASPLCKDEEVTFTNTSTGVTVNTNYQWQIGGQIVANSEDLQYTFSSIGNYTVRLILSEGDCTNQYETIISIGDNPVADFDYTADNLGFSFNSLSSNADSFAWDFGDGNSSTAQHSSYTYAESGTYTVCLTTNNDCGNDTHCEDITIVLCGSLIEDWQISYGGSERDLLNTILKTSDGGYLLGGYSDSGISGNKTTSGFGGDDFWIIKIDIDGNVVWEKVYGGSNNDWLFSIVATQDGGFLLGGASNSGISGNKTTTSYGNYDYWLVKIDGQGNKEWEQVYGGTLYDKLEIIQATHDGGYLLGGASLSDINGNKTSSNYGENDYWLVKIDADGNKLWDKSFGGNNHDLLSEIEPTNDGGFLLGGFSHSDSMSGIKTSLHHGLHDYWIIKIDEQGIKEWENSYGGNGQDYLMEMLTIDDGGYLLGGYSDSPMGGTKTSVHYGDTDYWLIKVNPLGVQEWESSYGGSGLEQLLTLSNSQSGNYLLGGYSISDISGNKTVANYNGTDGWMIEVASNGTKLMEYSYGGTQGDLLTYIEPLSDSYFLGLQSISNANTGNKTSPNYGGFDYWLIKIGIEELQSQFDTPIDPICLNLPVTFTNTSIGTTANTTYEWRIDGTVVSHGENLNHTFVNEGNHAVNLRISDGENCVDEYETIVIVETDSVADFDYIVNDLTINFHNLSTNGNSYSWDFGDGGSSSDVNPSHSFASEGTYTVCLTVSGECGGHSYCEDITLLLCGSLLEDWQASFGGSGHEYLSISKTTSDGGYILGGHSTSGISGNKNSASYGGSDYWVIKLDATGTVEWENVYGGTLNDNLVELLPTSDGGYLLAGHSQSGIGGNKTLANFGSDDYWIVKIDSEGAIEWQKVYGGSSFDQLGAIVETGGGGYLLGGRSNSGANGNKTSSSYGSFDYWLVKIDNQGNKEWEKAYGGSGSEDLYAIEAAIDGGFLIGGASNSGANGNKTSTSNGGYDYWAVKIADNGDVEWDKNFGGSDIDYLKDIQVTNDGGFLLGGQSRSAISGFKTSPHFGDYDSWIVKITENGNQEWDKSFGGSGVEHLADIEVTNEGNYIIGGDSASGISGNKTSVGFGSLDYWVLVIEEDGTKLGEYVYGGTTFDQLQDIERVGGTGYLLSGRTASAETGSKTTPYYGGDDYWVIKVFLQELQSQFDTPTDPICADESVTFTNTSTGNYSSQEWRINGNLESTDIDFTYTFEEAGTYIIELLLSDGDCTNTFEETITVVPNANQLDLGADILLCEGDTALLEANVADMAWYIWNNMGTTQSISIAEEGVYSLSVADACGNTALDEIQVTTIDDCVWPGDFNYDGVVNNLDLLSLGLAYNFTGVARPDASLDWEAQACLDWVGNLNDGVNYKHIDGNGDATINLSDPQAILANYGKSQGDLLEEESEDDFNGTVTIVPKMPNNTVPFSPEGFVPLQIEMHIEETNDLPVTVYGFAFHVKYGDISVEEVTVDFSNSWLGTPNNDMTYLVKHRPEINQINIAITGIDHQNRIGSGSFGIATLIVEDVVPTDDEFSVGIETVGVKLIDNQGITIPLGGISEDFTVYNQEYCPDGVVIEYSNDSDLPLLTWVGGEIFVGDLDGTGDVLVETNDEVELVAGSKIVFEPGFDTETGAVLNARIEACQQPEDFPDGDSPEIEMGKRNLDVALQEQTPSTSELEVIVFPNPTTDYTHIAYELPEDTKVSLSIINQTGKTMKQLLSNEAQEAGKYKVRFQACNMPAGLYYTVLRTTYGKKVVRLVVSK